MRTAILFAPQSLESEVASSCQEGGADWLTSVLLPWGYEVVRATGSQALAGLETALARVGKDDTLLVHVSGELRSATTLDLGSDEGLALAELDRVVSESGAQAFILAELTFSAGESDALALAGDIARIRAAFTSVGALVAVDGAARNEEGLPFTRLAIQAVKEWFKDGREEVQASDVVERLREMPESHAIVRSYTFVRGAAPFEIARLSDAMLDAPDLELLGELADRARQEGALTLAIAGYQAMLLGCSDEPARGLVYERLAAAEEAEGRSGRARRAYKKAILANPDRRGPRDSLVRLELQEHHWAPAIVAMRERLALIETPAEQVEELFAIARITLEKLRDMPGAVIELETARAIDPENEDVLEALRRSYRVLGRWSDLIDVTGALADGAKAAPERAARHFAQAQIAGKHLQNAELATTFLMAALTADPTHDEALDVLCELRASRQEESLLERELSSVLQDLLSLGDDDRAKDVAHRIAQLDTPPLRRAEATQEITADQMMGIDEEDEPAEVDLVSEIERAPLAPELHAALFAKHMRASQTDRAYLSASVLEELGPVDDAAEDVLEQCRPNGLRVRAGLDASAWQLLRAPGSDDVLEDLFRAIGRAASVTRAEERKAKKRTLVLDETKRQSNKSTASIVRTFHWAADILGVACPDLYVSDRVPGDLLAVPSGFPKNAPATLMGPYVLTGLSTLDLAFLCGRHLSYYCPEYSVLIDFPTLGELSLLVLAALQVALPAMPVPPNVEAAVAQLRSGLKQHLLPEEREAMRVAVAKLDARGGRVNLQAWIRSVELTATRVGLFLAGDLRTAMTRMRSETRTVSELAFESKRIDLIGFAATGGLAELRERFSAPATLRPPRESGMMTRADVGSPEWAEASVNAAG
jgi:tetratricopeptide (TPR) repeat protein